ncbi:MAG: hypothetical protein Fues2KO_47250 [Fuerstiella sp.]
MALYYHNARQLFSDVAPLADRRRFAVWDQRDDPQAAYTAHGWTPVTEAAPTYDNEPLTGEKVRVYLGNGEWQWQVDGLPWNECVDELEHARRQCEAAVNGVWQRATSQNLPRYCLPLGATLDRRPAAGEVVCIQLVDADLDLQYWPMVMAMNENTPPEAVETFEAVEGRVRIPGTPSLEWRHVLYHAAVAGRRRFTAYRDVKRDFALCETVEAYEQLALLADSIQFESDDSLLEPPERDGGSLLGL